MPDITPSQSTTSSPDSAAPVASTAPQAAQPTRAGASTGVTGPSGDAASAARASAAEAPQEVRAAKAGKPRQASVPAQGATADRVLTTPGRSETLRPTDARGMRLAVGNTPAAVEQTECWERFEEAMELERVKSTRGFRS